MKDFFAVTSLAISLGANIPYALDILKGKTRPERIAWLLWTILGGTYYLSSLIDEGATFLTFGEVVGPVIIFILSLKYGVGGKSRFDIVSLVIASIAFVLLFVLEGVLVSLLIALFIDSIGMVLTIRKLRLDPTSESRLFWALGIVSGSFGLLSLESYSLTAILFPAYLAIASALIVHEIHKAKPHPERIKDL